MTDVSITIDWGARSERLRVLLKASRKSFLLQRASLPVAVGTLKVRDAGFGWDHAPVNALAMTPIPGTSTATTAFLDSTQFLRLDFKLDLTIGNTTSTCLEFRQLFAVGSAGALLPQQYSIEDFVWKRGSPTPVRERGPAAGGRRAFLGTCPLLRVLPQKLEVNCEFLDVTEIWWKLWATKDRWGWYLDPDLGGNCELLRVLAWTSGAHPMLWYVAISSLAANGRPPMENGEAGKKGNSGAPASFPADRSPPATSGRRGADLVFFRPITGRINSFSYKLDESGFLASEHGDITVRNLARWLLAPMPHEKITAKLQRLGTQRLPFRLELMGIRLIPNKRMPKFDPADPIDLVQQDALWAFRPVGIEGALSRSAYPDMVFLPLGSEAAVYPGLTVTGEIREVLTSARSALWVRSAFGRDRTATPDFDREIWLAGHSAQNRQMFQCLTANQRDVDRIISCDATRASELLIPEGIPAVASATKARAGVGKKFRAIFMTTPNMWADKSAYQAIAKQLASTKADVAFFPIDSEWDAYWKYPPTEVSNPHVFEVLREWDGNGLSASSRFGKIHPPPPARTFQWLFWHEWAVDGGHLVMDAKKPTVVDHVRSFLEDVLQLP